MYQIIAHTPIWVFGLLVFLVFIGYLQTRTRQITAVRLVIVPAAMIALSLAGVISSFGFHPIGLGVWVLGVSIAVGLNHLFKQPRGVTYDSTTKLFTLPGSWIPFVLIMAIFLTKYFVGASAAMHPELINSTEFLISICLILGLLSGTFLARAIYSFCVVRCNEK